MLPFCPPSRKIQTYSPPEGNLYMKFAWHTQKKSLSKRFGRIKLDHPHRWQTANVLPIPTVIAFPWNSEASYIQVSDNLAAYATFLSRWHQKSMPSRWEDIARAHEYNSEITSNGPSAVDAMVRTICKFLLQIVRLFVTRPTEDPKFKPQFCKLLEFWSAVQRVGALLFKKRSVNHRSISLSLTA